MDNFLSNTNRSNEKNICESTLGKENNYLSSSYNRNTDEKKNFMRSEYHQEEESEHDDEDDY